MSRHQLKINSRDRINKSSTSSSNFTIQLESELHGGFELHYIYMPQLYQNITERNNRVYFEEDAEEKVAYLRAGKYVGGNTLKNELVTALNDASGGFNTYSATIDSLTNFITITATSDFSLKFTNTECSCAEVLGFADANYSSTDLSLTGIKTFNLALLQSFNIIINDISTMHDTNHIVDPTFCIPILNNLNEIQYFEPTESKHYQFEILKKDKTKTLNIRVVDDTNTEINLESEWYMVIRKTRH